MRVIIPALALMFSSTVLAQTDPDVQHGAPAQQDDYKIKQISEETKHNVSNLMNFTQYAGAYAGVMQECKPEEINRIKACVLYNITDTLSHIEDTKDKNTLSKQTHDIWNQSFVFAYRKRLSNDPSLVSCDTLIEEESKDKMWNYCPKETVFDGLLKYDNTVSLSKEKIQ